MSGQQYTPPGTSAPVPEVPIGPAYQTHPLVPVVGRAVHVWESVCMPRFLRHDIQPFSGRICFVHPDGDVTVRYADHYGAEHIDTHMPLRQPTGQERHGHGGTAFCTWPVRT